MSKRQYSRRTGPQFGNRTAVPPDFLLQVFILCGQPIHRCRMSGLKSGMTARRPRLVQKHNPVLSNKRMKSAQSIFDVPYTLDAFRVEIGHPETFDVRVQAARHSFILRRRLRAVKLRDCQSAQRCSRKRGFEVKKFGTGNSTRSSPGRR